MKNFFLEKNKITAIKLENGNFIILQHPYSKFKIHISIYIFALYVCGIVLGKYTEGFWNLMLLILVFFETLHLMCTQSGILGYKECQKDMLKEISNKS